MLFVIIKGLIWVIHVSDIDLLQTICFKITRTVYKKMCKSSVSEQINIWRMIFREMDNDIIVLAYW